MRFTKRRAGEPAWYVTGRNGQGVETVTAAPGDRGVPSVPPEPRGCPICGSRDESHVIGSNIDADRINRFSFASRKEPEYMHHRLVVCPVCRLRYASPAPSAESIALAYRDALYDSADESRDAARTYARALSKVAPRLPPRGNALDIGAGDGAFLAELIAAGFEDVVGVEPSSAPIESAAPEVRARIRQGVFRASDFDAGQFRLVTAFQVLEHVSDPLAVFRDAHTLLADGGALLVVVHDQRAIANRLLGHRSPIYDIEHLQLFSRHSISELFSRAGFELVSVHSILNTYPLRYWLRLFPFPQAAKRWLLNRVGSTRVGALRVSLPVGNLVAVGYKSSSRTELSGR
jgi:SAM-dependent methyltransferase